MYQKDRCHDSTQKAAAGEGQWQGDMGEIANLNSQRRPLGRGAMKADLKEMRE